MSAAMSAVTVLAGPVSDVNYFGDTRGGALAGPLGLFIIIVLAVATVMLIRNMNKRLRRLPPSFPGQEPPAEGGNEPGARPGNADNGRPENADNGQPPRP